MNFRKNTTILYKIVAFCDIMILEKAYTKRKNKHGKI